MAALDHLVAYHNDSDSSDEEKSDKRGQEQTSSESTLHLKSTQKPLSKSLALINAAPIIDIKPVDDAKPLDVDTKEVFHNPKYGDLYAPQIGPENPFKSNQQKAVKNMLSGYVEPAHVSDFHFERERRTFHSYGYALDPTTMNYNPKPATTSTYVGNEDEATKNKGLTVFEPGLPENKQKRRREKASFDPTDIDNFQGPWRKLEDEETVSKPTGDQEEELKEYLAKRKKKGKVNEEAPIEEKSILHIKDPVDYQGRSFLHAPKDVGVNLLSEDPPAKCYIPKREIHAWVGHSKAVTAIRWFPVSAHLILSSSMDSKIKIWEVYKERRCVRTYTGHKQSVRDICFNNGGDKFLSASYDRFVKLWDTETGKCISRFAIKKVPYCVKFNPDADKQHLFVAGCSDKKIVCFDTNTGEITQEYDRHLGAVNSITFIDDNRRFVSTSDDKSLRFWEWDIPVDFKYIADPTMHAIPTVTLSPNQKFLACQSMDNKVHIYTATESYRKFGKKEFKGHMAAGYACGVDFSPDMSYVMSGDADGKVYIWSWRNCRIVSRFKAHDKVCNGVLWHPHETSKIATCGWDGLIRFWD